MNMYKIKDHPNLSFKLINRVTGWVTFVIASMTYILTAESTASLWDCGEFITTSVGLQVGHPPGAPLFMIISRLFAIFAPSADTQAYMINCMSAICSGLTILFLFWSITHLARKLIVKEGEEMTMGQMFAILGASLIGSLTYTFTDTFWFSAVEGEVYAMSSLFTAVVFWAILKWENVAFERYANRWLILIAYLIGLSIGVHLLNLLAIPAIVFVYYFKKYTPTVRGFIKTGILSVFILGVVNFGIIPGVIKVAGWFELTFVNGMGAPFNTGVIIYVLLIIGALVWGIRYTLKKGMPVWNTILTCFMVILIGYSSYSMIVIRSLSDPPIDEGSPDNVFSLLSYINRDQYGDAPLLYGQYFNAPQVGTKEGEPIYYQNKETGVYEKIGNKTIYEYDKRFCGFFPRMYSDTRPNFANQYQAWAGRNNGPTYTVNGETITRPSFGNNMRYFFNYQLGHMYWRYFMWNFSGRQNDIQGYGDIMHGNWITGIPFIDNLLYGDQNMLPQELKDNKGHNVFYCLPLILGIIGLFWQAWRGQKGIQQFWVVFFLFFMTGIAIVLYLNQTPGQPRERDYAYAGSFYAFAIWIGMGVAGIVHLLRNYMKEVPAAALTSAVCLLVPIQMASQTWDDHDRSGRYVARDFGQNYLMSLQESGNPIIYTNGDNDTFPLWYNQETEGFRTDARTCNLSYLQTDWYIDQMKRPAYDSPALPITWDRTEYMEGQNEYVPIRPDFKKQIDKAYKAAEEEVLNGKNPEALNNIRAQFGDNPYELKNILKYWVRTKDGQAVIPTDSIVVKIDKEAVRRSGMMIPEALGDSIPDYMHISLKDEKGNPKRALYKSELMMLEMLANANWERPIYMAITVGTDNQLNMREHFIQEGLTYRFTPFDTEALGATIDSEKMYDNLMNKFKFGGIDKPGIYIDENTMRMCYTHRRIFAQLITQLMKEGKKDKALAALEYAEKMIPAFNVPYDVQNGALEMAEAYYQLGNNTKADQIIDELANKSVEYLTWYLSLDDNHLLMSQREFIMHLSALDMEVKMMEKYKSKLAGNYTPKVNELYNIYVGRMKAHQ